MNIWNLWDLNPGSDSLSGKNGILFIVRTGKYGILFIARIWGRICYAVIII